MKLLIIYFGLFIVIIMGTTIINGQSVGDFRSAQNGSWSSASTWEVWNGSVWVPAGNAPTGAENIAVDDTVEVDISVNIAGYITVSGIGNLEIPTGSLTFTNGSTYEHARNSGGIPVSTWATGSTCKITGITNQAPANRNQSFYNLIWNCPNQSGNFNMGFSNVTIGGDISIMSTGASSRWYLCGPVTDSTATVTLLGDLIQTGGQVASNGTGNGNTTIIINQYGDINASNGNFSISRGSQGGTGTTTWSLHGSNFSLNNVTTQNSNPTGAKFVFAGTTQQNLTLVNVSYGGGGFPLEIAAGAIMNAGLSEIAGNGIFTLNDNGTLQTGNVAGLDSTIKTTGVVTLSNAANYTFNGSSAQVTGNRLPTVINNFTVNNAAGVTLTPDVAVTGNLTLTNGDLHLNGHFIDLGMTGTLSETPGNTVTDLSGSIGAVRDLNAPNGVNLGGLGVMFTSTDNLGTISVSRVHSPAIGNGNQGILRQFMIDFVLGPITTSLRFYYDESELNGISEGNLTLFNSPVGLNNTWSPAGGVLNTSGNYLELLNLPGLTPYWTFADINAPIPVELTSFTANLIKDGVVLDWATATETNNRGWHVERMQLDENLNQAWQQISFVEGSGNSTSNKDYSYTDKNVVSGQYQYRLQQIDHDGTINYSDVIKVEVSFVPTEFALYQNYPNPFNPSTTIKFDLPSSSFVNISIYNSIGEKVITAVNKQMEAGIHLIQIDARNLPSGMYLYRLSADEKLLTKKMLLIK